VLNFGTEQLPSLKSLLVCCLLSVYSCFSSVFRSEINNCYLEGARESAYLRRVNFWWSRDHGQKKLWCHVQTVVGNIILVKFEVGSCNRFGAFNAKKNLGVT